MAKLKLDPDRLHVESFGTLDASEESLGTVRAHSYPLESCACLVSNAPANTCTCPNTSVGQDCFCTESPTCWQCVPDEDS
ncbi:MAG TPA: hypothetical protein VFS20_27870 [Longimicrobium sp.]|nr:hypothetical protein [Longimicrobium sp.]